jgi:DNA-binding transcriptional LysR family regulator
MALEMAVAGQGVALTYAEAAAPYLADGRLVRVSDITAISHRNAWMLWRVRISVIVGGGFSRWWALISGDRGQVVA